MVFKPSPEVTRSKSAFENDVKTYGIQTEQSHEKVGLWFENDVKKKSSNI